MDEFDIVIRSRISSAVQWHTIKIIFPKDKAKEEIELAASSATRSYPGLSTLVLPQPIFLLVGSKNGILGGILKLPSEVIIFNNPLPKSTLRDLLGTVGQYLLQTYR